MDDHHRTNRSMAWANQDSEDPRPDRFENDYDRVFYSSYLRRLASVTQVVNPSEGVIFHNRLTHTFKVSHFGRQLAGRLLAMQASRVWIDSMGGLDPMVVATAALAHDLGNPPFGHAAEEELDRLIVDRGVAEGFEGNAQSFRIVAWLACYDGRHQGLNLTWAVLNAMLKYPWTRDIGNSKSYHHRKFGVYEEERAIFEQIRAHCGLPDGIKCLEAAIMDVSDDITYAVHDFCDLIRADFLPITPYITFFSGQENPSRDDLKDHYAKGNFPVIKGLVETLMEAHEAWAPSWQEGDLGFILERLNHFFNPIYQKTLVNPNGFYRGTRQEKIDLKQLENNFLRSFLENIEIREREDGQPALIVNQPSCDDIIILKALTKTHIINSPALMKQQAGEKTIIRGLFEVYERAIGKKDEKLKKELKLILPTRSRETLDDLRIGGTDDPGCYRVIGDAISGLTDVEAIVTYSRLMGVSPGSIFDRQVG